MLSAVIHTHRAPESGGRAAGGRQRGRVRHSGRQRTHVPILAPRALPPAACPDAGAGAAGPTGRGCSVESGGRAAGSRNGVGVGIPAGNATASRSRLPAACRPQPDPGPGRWGGSSWGDLPRVLGRIRESGGRQPAAGSASRSRGWPGCLDGECAGSIGVSRRPPVGSQGQARFAHGQRPPLTADCQPPWGQV